MRKLSYLTIALLIVPVLMFAKKMEISVTPSVAEIFVNGKKVGTGSIVIDIKKDNCITVLIRREGFLSYYNEYCNKKGMPDIPKLEHIQLAVDQSFEASTKSDIANVDVVI